MSLLDTSTLSKLDYDSKFEIIKQYIKQKPLIEKFKFLYEYNDKRLISYFKNKFIIPVNISSFEDDLPLLNENMSLTRFISKHNFTIKDDFFIYWITDCYKKCDIPILEWWLYSGIYDDGTLTKSIDLVYVISKKKNFYDEETTRISNFNLNNTVLPDIEVLEWYSRNNIKILGTVKIFTKYFTYNGLLKHSIWMFDYIKKSSKNDVNLKNEFNKLFEDDNEELPIIFYNCALNNNYTMFNWLILSGFPYNQFSYDLIKTYSELQNTTYILNFFDNYNKKNNIKV